MSLRLRRRGRETDPEQLGALNGKFGIPKIDVEKKKSGKDD
jgi:hypothetical protein